MSLGQVQHQKPAKPPGKTTGRTGNRGGEAAPASVSDETKPARHAQTDWGAGQLLRQTLVRENMAQAWKHVKANKGSPGVDRRTIEETEQHLKTAWPTIRDSLLNGSYRPQPVRRVDIAKAGGGTRQLGIPTVIDRLIQQALLQILQPLIDPTFSEHSHGFRPKRSAHGAINEAQQYVQAGYTTVVDVDLEKFFDCVNHDVLMDRLSKRIDDKSVLRLIRRYLQTGIMTNGVHSARIEGTPQGGPLSPLLANVLLDEVDQQLQRHGQRFVRYADDCNVYVKSHKAGERVLKGLRDCYAKLRLTVNETKTAVAPVWGRKFLGYCWKVTRAGELKCAVSSQALDKLRQRIKELTQRKRGRSLEQVAQDLRRYVPGWKAYFRLAQTPTVMRDLDKWLRHRLRALKLKQWKRGRTAYRELIAMGVNTELARQIAAGSKKWWHGSRFGLNRAMPVSYFDQLGVPKFS